jgi:uncharacterized membrane protein
MPTTRHEIDVRAKPLETFGWLTKLEQIPRWMAGVQAVRPVDGAMLWDSLIAGVPRSWMSRMTSYDPGVLLDWAGFADPAATARFTFWAASPTTTTIGVTLGWHPEPGNVGDPHCIVAWRIDEALEKLRSLVESALPVRAA